MGITRIIRLENRSTAVVRLVDVENQNTLGNNVDVPPGAQLAVDMWVPWPSQSDFQQKHLQIQIAGVPRFWIWQAAGPDGDFLRWSSDGSWHAPGEHVRGVAVAGMWPPPLTEDRTIQVYDGWFEVVDLPAAVSLKSVLGSDYHLAPTQPAPDPPDIPSVPKASAVAWSMAGGPSDAFDQHQAGARFLYRDSGKRWEFQIRNGVVVAIRPDRTEQPLTQAVSYDVHRLGDRFTAPPFDLVAAGGGRVFAKEQGKDHFYFAILDEMFIQGNGSGGEVAVPSVYFKLDPEFNGPGAVTRHKVDHLVGNYFDHPGSERFPLFRRLMEWNVTDFMVVKVERGVWHRLDCRSPLGQFVPTLLAIETLTRGIENAAAFSAWSPAYPLIKVVLDDWHTQALQARQDLEAGESGAMAPPDGVPRRNEVRFTNGTFTIEMPGVKFVRVLDIAVGHVHTHQQYEQGFGGELQPIRTGPRIGSPLDFISVAWGYRLFNGPLRDGDGFIDGTSNFYALVELATQTPSFALLVTDEQTYFSQRWRLADPDDTKGLGFALVADLDADASRSPRLYPQWDKAKWWSPFNAGRIGATSRLAVAAQVVLVTGVASPDSPPLLYSTNFSFSTMDTTWRWRPLPAAAAYFPDDAARTAETIQPSPTGGDCVYPETIRIREDLTIHLRGFKNGVAGRYFQRYLPFDHRLLPPIEEVVAGQAPGRGYVHPWKFLPEEVFHAADRFSHFGVYGTVDSRTQYYEVTPVGTEAEAALAAGEGGAWLDVQGQLTLRAWKFWWGAPMRIPNFDLNLSNQPLEPHKHPPSIFNPDTRLKILRRGNRWLAFHWDKRDDELMPFESGPFGPLTVALTNGDLHASVSVGANSWDDAPPGVEKARFVWPSGDAYPIQVVLSNPKDVWRVRLAAFDPAPGPTGTPNVVTLLDVEFAGNFLRVGAEYQYTFSPDAAQRANLRRFCTPAGARTHGTSLWVEDVLGHVAIPDALVFETPLAATASPDLLPLGMPTSVTVHAQDLLDGGTVAAQVLVDGVFAGPTDTAIPRTFNSRFVTETDPETHTTSTIEEMPELSVIAEGHTEAGVIVQFYHPALTLSVQPASIRVGQPTAVTVRSVDSRTGALVAGRVILGGIDVGATNSSFTTTFTGLGTVATVVATGYPSKNVGFPLALSTFQVWVEPNGIPVNRSSNLIVHAVDAVTGTPVAARVLLAGQDVAAANTSFVYAFGTTPPAGLVRATFYTDGAIPWPTFYTPRLVVGIQPYPVPVGTAVTCTVSAREAFNNQPIDGEVRLDGVLVGRTNVPFSATFRLRKVKVFDADLRKWIYVNYPPELVVAASGYPQMNVDLGIAT